MDPTPSQTVGPFYSIGLRWEDGGIADPDGVLIFGRLFDGAGEPINDGVIELWHQAETSFARSETNEAGQWQVTVSPAPFYAIHVFARGLLRHLTTRVYLNSDERDPVMSAVPSDRRETLIAESAGDGFRFDIRIQGELETVFFDV